MSSSSIRTALAISALALMPLPLWAGAPAQAVPPKHVASLASFHSTLDVPIEEIAASLGGCAILDKDFPGLRTHSMYRMFKTMSLNQIAAMSHGQITADMLAQAQTDLSALPIKVVARGAHQPDGDDLDFVTPGGPGSVLAPK